MSSNVVPSGLVVLGQESPSVQLGHVVATGRSRVSVQLWLWFPTIATLAVFLDLHVSVYKCFWQQDPIGSSEQPVT